MEQIAKVKDFVIDVKKATGIVKETSKKRKNNTEHTFEVVLENNTDFVIRRITPTTDKSLVFLISQGVFYIKNNKNDEVETLSLARLRSFFIQIYRDSFTDFKKVAWWNGGSPEDRVELMMRIVANSLMQKFYQHNIFIDMYSCEAWKDIFEANTKLFEYCYSKVKDTKNSYNFDGICKFCKIIYDKYDYNNAVYFVDKLIDGNVQFDLSTNRYYGHSKYTSDCDTLLELIATYNLNFNRAIDYFVDDLYAQGVTKFTRDILSIYRDCLVMQVGMYGKVKDKYPKHLKTDHDIIALKFNTYQKYKKDLLVFNITEQNKELEWSDREYSIILPKTAMDIVDEGINMSNCVGSYVDKVVNQDCIIMFLRKNEEIDKSYITLEVRAKEIVQAKGFANRKLDDDEKAILDKWAKARKLILKC